MSIHVKTADGWEEIGASSGGGDLVGGVAGWAAIESVTGTASLDDLKTAGIAPTTATEDTECPGTYNIVGDDGVVWRVAVWTDVDATHSIDTTNGFIEGVLISGGAAGAGSYGQPASVGLPSWNDGFYELGDGPKDVVVGKRGVPNSGGVHANAQSTGKPSLVGDWSSGTSGAGGGPLTLTSSISGLLVEYGTAAIGGSGGGFTGSGNATYGTDGIVVVRAPKDAANNPKPDAPVAWGQFNSVPTGFTDEGAYGPDAQGRTWKWYEFADPGDFTIDLSGGQYWVLCVGGGSGGINSTHPTDQGQPGLVNEGYWEFPANDATPIKVGQKGPSYSGSDAGRPSSVGDYGTQGISGWGDVDTGRGSLVLYDNIGYKSRIAGGTEREFATGYKRSGPGRAGYRSDEQTDGCVIIATVTNSESEWNPPGALPGVGGWAQITSVTGMPNRYTYKDGTTDWVAFEWFANGQTNSVTTDKGIVDSLIVGGGQRTSTSASGGSVNAGLHLFEDGTHILEIADWNQTTGSGDSTWIETNSVVTVVSPGGAGSYNRGAGALSPGQIATPVLSSITGVEEAYGAGQSLAITNKKYKGSGWSPNREESGGAVIIRVPADQAAGVDPTTYNDVTTFDLTNRQKLAGALKEAQQKISNREL